MTDFEKTKVFTVVRNSGANDSGLGVSIASTPGSAPGELELELDVDVIEDLIERGRRSDVPFESTIVHGLAVGRHELLQYKHKLYSEGIVELKRKIDRDKHERLETISAYVDSGSSEIEAKQKGDLKYPQLDLNINLVKKYELMVKAVESNYLFDNTRVGGSELYQVELELKQALKELSKLKGKSRKPLRAQICQQIISFAHNYTTFTNGYKNIALTGKAGIGKTTAAKILAAVYKNIGVLVYGDLISTGPDHFIAGYIGQTAIKTNGVLSSSLENVLLIDEAYSLTNCDVNEGTLIKSGGASYTNEAMTQIVNFLSNHRGQTIVIVAGYDNAIKGCFFKSNEGLPRRFPIKIELPDYSVSDLSQIFYDMVSKNMEEHVFDGADGKLDPYKKIFIHTIVNYLHDSGMLPNQAGDIENLVSNFQTEYYTAQTLLSLRGVDDPIQILKLAMEKTVVAAYGLNIAIELTAGPQDSEAVPMTLDPYNPVIDGHCPPKRAFDDFLAKVQVRDDGQMCYKIDGKEVCMVQKSQVPIGAGAYGSIWAFHDSAGLDVVVKTFKFTDDGPDNELEIVKKLGNDVKCDIINAVHLQNVLVNDKMEKDVVVMARMTGDMYQLVTLINTNMSRDTVMGCFMQLVNTAYCLVLAGYVYIDYKLANMLYRCSSDGQIVNIAYGDLGSIHPLGTHDYLLITYVPWDRKHTNRGRHIVSKSKATTDLCVWGLAVCFVELHKRTMSSARTLIYALAAVEDKIEDYNSHIYILLEEFINEAGLNDPPFYGGMSMGDILRDMLTPNADDRINIAKLHQVLGLPSLDDDEL